MLYTHQQEAVKFILEKGSCFLHCSVGLGKTLMALTAYKERLKSEPNLKLLVVCPISLIEGAWIEDILKFYPELTYCNLRKKVTDANIYLINFESYYRPTTYSKISKLYTNNDVMCVIDESGKIRNFKAIITKRLLMDRNKYKYRICMSGTPFPNSLTEAWSQYNFISDIFHKSFYAYRNEFFYLGRGYQKAQGFIPAKQLAEMLKKGFKYQITEDNKRRILNAIKPSTFYRKKEDCLDLPAQIFENRIFEMGTEQAKLYKEMKNYLIIELNDMFVTGEIAIKKLIKLRQIVSGFVYDEKHNAQTFKCPRLGELADTLDEIGDNQVIIWCQFREEIRQVCEMLKGKGVSQLHGGIVDRQANIEAFKAGRTQYLVAHPMSAGHGLSFPNATYQIFYSLDFNRELYEQCIGRSHRVTTKNDCIYINLIAKDSIDEYMLKVLKGKASLDEVVREVLQ